MPRSARPRPDRAGRGHERRIAPGARAAEDADPAQLGHRTVRTRARPAAAPSAAPPGPGARSRSSRPASTGRASARRAAPTPARRSGRSRTRRCRAAPVAIRPRHVPRANVSALAAARARVAGQRQREHAHVARPASLGRQAVERGEQLGVVVGVGGVLAGVAPRPDARPAVERVDLEPGVVGERRQAGGARPRSAP